ncbi:MAG: DUF2203 domain-containing protein [Candidatus Peregrinibacteria bacterium]|nr:DUF2203 domain-containing protein [Candidatus Peregrinibacteria bacterium]MDZ4244505.1 DUF2203 domain-containing protein [Candidatus Gracilibacteria bacterium]
MNNITNMKFFSISQANKSLALVTPIVEDIQTKWVEVKKLKEDCDAIILNHLESENILNEKQDRLDDLLEEIENNIEELQEIGAEFKGFEKGLVDFPAKIDTRIIYLCWRRGEKNISCWHEIFEGFSNRKDISNDLRGIVEKENQTKTNAEIK